MEYNLAYKNPKINAFKQLGFYAEKGLIVKLEVVKNTRSNLQNRALHLYFDHVAKALIEIGYDYIYVDVITGEMIHIPYNKDLVKNYIWRPLQKRMFELESTTKLTTKIINDILEVLGLWLGEKNKSVSFPNKIDMIIEKMLELENK